MRKFIPALRIALLVCVVFLAAITMLNFVAGADKPFSTVFPLLMGMLALGMLSGASLTAPKCPTCDTLQPAIRRPTSFRQMIWGGWTCAKCGTEIDRHGHSIGKPATH